MTSPGSQTAGPGETDVLHCIISFFSYCSGPLLALSQERSLRVTYKQGVGYAGVWSPVPAFPTKSTHTHTHTESNTHTHTHTHTLTLTHAHTHTRSHTHTLSQQSHTHSHTHIHTNTHSHTHTLSHTHTHTHTCTRPTEEWGQPGSQPTLAAREDMGRSQQVTFSPEGRPSVSGSQPTGLRTCAHSFTAKEAGKVSVCFPSFSIGRWTLPPLIR